MFDFERLELAGAVGAEADASNTGNLQTAPPGPPGKGTESVPGVLLEVRGDGRRYAVMPDGVGIRFDLLGKAGRCVVLIPGGQGGVCDGQAGKAQFPLLRRLLPHCGYRVLLHDRRNTGSSDVGYGDGTAHEAELQAMDLAVLLRKLQLGPAVLVGNSSGGRLSLLLARREPSLVHSLVLMNLTGGPQAAEFLSAEYYGKYISLAESESGMGAVAEAHHYVGLCRDNPRNASLLQGLRRSAFVAAMRLSSSWLAASGKDPVLGHSASELAKVQHRALVVFSMHRAHCQMHTLDASQRLHGALPAAEGDGVALWETRDAIASGVVEFLGRLG